MDLKSFTNDELASTNVQATRCYVAIDGGGTKTECVLFNEYGNIVRLALSGSTNINVVGEETAKKNLLNGLDGLLLGIKPSGIYAGIAGCLPKNKELLVELLLSYAGDIPIRVNSDVINVIYSVPEAEDKCIAVICGTGSSVFSWDGRNLARYGGWGYLFDKAGSGYDIGCDILRECFALEDGFGNQSLVTKLAEEKLGGRAVDRLIDFYACQRSFIASLAPIAFKAYRKGDDVAKNIIMHNMERISFLIKAANKLSFNNENIDVIISGGLTKDGDIIKECLNKMLGEKYNIIFPGLPQIYGAAVAALNFFCDGASHMNMKKFYEAFSHDYKKIKGV